MSFCSRRWFWGISLLVVLAFLIEVSPATGNMTLALRGVPAGNEAVVPMVGTAAEPTVRMFVFYTETCPACKVIVNDFLPALKGKYGTRLDYQLFEISNPIHMQMLVALERAYGVPADRATIPEIFIGRDVFLGAEAIRQDLEATINEYLKEGGVDLTPPMKQALTALQSKGTIVVQAILFHMPSCSHCEEIIQQVLPFLKRLYGEQFQVKLVDVTSDAAYEEFSDYVASRTGSKELVGVPTMVISDTILIAAGEIRAQVQPVIEQYLSRGGTKYPELPAGLDGPEYQLPLATTATPSVIPTQSPTVIATSAEKKPVINLAYFHQPGCQECDRVQLALNYLQSRYPQLEVAAFDVKEYAALNEWLAQRAGVPQERRLTAPAIFVGQDALVGEDIYLDRLEALMNKYQESGAPQVWEDFQGETAKENIIQHFMSLGLLTVVGAGLLDGLNPCAFATIVFFISYLSLSGKKGREVLAVGAAFTLGVFLAYLAVGLGLWKVLGALGFLTALRRWVYIITAILCAVLAVFSFLDFLKARRGQAEDMALSLPRALRKRINALIRTGQGARVYVAVALATGAAVSLIELACTGQVYLPTIIFVLSVPSLRLRAFFYLLLYNLCFITPLIVVFLLAYFGTTTLQLAKFLRTHTATIKLGTTVLFLALTGWLVYVLL